MSLIPQTPLGPLGRLAAEAEAMAIRRAIVTPIAPRRVPPNIWAALIVGGVLLYPLIRAWLDARDNPVQGPPIPLSPGSPAMNNDRTTSRNTQVGDYTAVPGAVGGTAKAPGAQGLQVWDYGYRLGVVRAENGERMPDQVSASIASDFGYTRPVAYLWDRKQFGWESAFVGIATGPSVEDVVQGTQTGGNPSFVFDRFEWSATARPPANGVPSEAARQWYPGASPAADPTDVAGSLRQGLTQPQPRIGTPPIGAPLPEVASGSSVGAGGAGVGVPASAIPSAPSIGSTGARDATSAAQAAAAAAAAAAAVGTIGATGALTGVQAPAIPTTPAGALVLPGVTLFPQAVTGTIAAIAAEVGRLESKAEFTIGGPPAGGDNGPNIWDAIEAILQFLASMTDGAPAQTWTLAEGCPAVPGVEPESRSVEIPATSDNTDAMLARFDALAEMIQNHKDLRGPICRGRRPEGVGVTVNFRSLGPDGATGRPLRKELSYRDPGGGSLASHTAHWSGFQWQAGSTVVSHDESRLGAMKVWASDADEGIRVIRHAAEAAGVNPDTEGIWSVVEVQDDRFGRSGTMEPQALDHGGIAVTVRPGSSGSPHVLTGG